MRLSSFDFKRSYLAFVALLIWPEWINWLVHKVVFQLLSFQRSG